MGGNELQNFHSEMKVSASLSSRYSNPECEIHHAQQENINLKLVTLSDTKLGLHSLSPNCLRAVAKKY